MTLDLSTLPDPKMIETLNVETIITEMMAEVQARFSLAGVDYDVGGLEVDPVKIVVEAAAARELKIRARFNDGLRANLVPLSTGTDLDHLGAFYGVTRLPDETDEIYRIRITLGIIGRSPAGPEERYEVIAKSVSTSVQSVKAYRTDLSPNVYVAVYTSDNGGVPTQQLLDDIQAALDSPSVRVVSDVITVLPAVTTTVDVTADVWLLPEAQQSAFDKLEGFLLDSLADEGGLGFDINTSWIDAKLHESGGVSRVEISEPSASVVVPYNEAAALGTITLTYKGRAR